VFTASLTFKLLSSTRHAITTVDDTGGGHWPVALKLLRDLPLMRANQNDDIENDHI
jgi:hypothetical protein